MKWKSTWTMTWRLALCRGLQGLGFCQGLGYVFGGPIIKDQHILVLLELTGAGYGIENIGTVHEGLYRSYDWSPLPCRFPSEPVAVIRVFSFLVFSSNKETQKSKGKKGKPEIPSHLGQSYKDYYQDQSPFALPHH